MREAMKTKIIAVALIVIGVTGHAYADTTTANASQAANSAATAQGEINFSQTPADSHISETVRNVSAPVLGAYAPNMNGLGCTSTAQGGAAVAGFSAAFGAPKIDHGCTVLTGSAEMARQAYNIRQRVPDSPLANMLDTASVQMKCRYSVESYQSLEDAGVDCNHKPDGMTK